MIAFALHTISYVFQTVVVELWRAVVVVTAQLITVGLSDRVVVCACNETTI